MLLDKDQIVQAILIAEKKLKKENTEENAKELNRLKDIGIKRLEEFGECELANSFKEYYDIEKGNESFQDITE